MSYQIVALDPEPFSQLFEMSDAELETRGARRLVSDGSGFPCRVSLTDVPAGQAVVLTNIIHHDEPGSPFRASGPVFVSRTPRAAFAPDTVPHLLATRLLSVRAYDADGMMSTADVVEGVGLDTMLNDLFTRKDVAYVHMHYARQGCYAARADRT